MPTFAVTDERTGRKFQLEGDSEPDEQELEEIFASQEQQAPAAPPDLLSEFSNATLDPGYFPGLERDRKVAEMRRDLNLEPVPIDPVSVLRRGVADPAISLAKGVIGLPEAAVGLLDIPTLGGAGKLLEAGGYGFQPKVAKEFLSEFYSPEQKEANRAVEEAKGFGGTIVKALQNPSTIANTAIESVPLMLGGGAVAKQLLTKAPKLGVLAAAAIGEGAAGAGAAAESTRQQTDSGLLTPQQAALSLSSGAVTGALGVLGGRVAQKLGIADIDTLMAGATTPTAKKALAERVVQGFVSEGLLEELPQSALEQIQGNLANGRPWSEGVEKAAAQGLLTGGVMGGGANIRGATPAAAPVIQDTGVNPALSAAAAEFNRRGVGIAGLPETQPIQEFDETGSGLTAAPPLVEEAQPIADAPVSLKLPGETAADELMAMPTEQANKFFDDIRAAGNATQNDAVLHGMKLTEQDVPRLQEMERQARSDAQAAVKANDSPGYKSAFGKMVWLNGAIEGANKKGPNFDTVTQRLAKESAPKPLTGEEIGEMLGSEFRGEAGKGGTLLQFEAKKPDGTASTSFSVKKGATADEVRAKYQEVMDRYKDDPENAPRPLPQEAEPEMEFTALDPATGSPISSIQPLLEKADARKAKIDEQRATAQPAPTGVGPGMGGALYGETAPAGTTLKNASGELERITSGLPEAFETQKRAMLPVWIQSGELMAKDPQSGAKLAAELKINPERGMTDLDSALLLRHKVALENAKNQAAEDTNTAKTPEAKLEAQNRFDAISNEMLDLLDAAKFRGAQWGREGRWRQAIAFEDFSLETMRRDARLKADRPLTPEEEADIKRRHKDITDKQKRVDEATAKAEKDEREAGQKDAVDEAVKTGKARKAKDKAAGIVRDMEAEQREAINFLKDHFIENGELIGGERSIRKLMELIVEREGITERLPLETRVHEILIGVDPTLTREATLDLMSGYGKSKLPSQEPSKKVVRDIAAQIISVRKLLDYFKGKQPSLTGMLRDAPSDIQRDLTRIVNLAKKNFKLDGPTDNPKAIKSAIDAINTRLKNRISDLKQEIATRQKITRERSPSPYNAETLRLRQELETLQAERDSIFGTGLTPAQQLERAEKSAERQIAELERQIKTGEIFSKSKVPFSGESPQLTAAKAKIEELKLQRQFAREAIQPRTEPEVVRNEARVKSLDKQIQAIEKQLADDAVFSKPKKERTPSEDSRIQEREAKLEELKKERQFARERNQPGIEPHEAFLLNYLMRLRRSEADYTDRLAKGDFQKKAKKEPETDPQILAAMAKVEKAKSDYRRGLAQYELNRRSRNQKIWDGIKLAKNAFVNIISSYDFSAPRQAFGAILGNATRLITNPKRGAELLATPFRDMFRAWASEETSSVIEQRIKNRPNALNGADKKAGIQYTDLHNPIFTKREENAQSVLDDLAALPIKTGNALKTTVTAPLKIAAKGVRMSNRAFVTYLNVTRAGLFDELLRAQFSDRPPTDVELKVIGNIVNLATGRGDLSPGVAKAASEILWAPSLLASRIQTLVGQPFWGKSGREGGSRARKIAAQEYARWIVSGAALYAISRLFDDDDDKITSSDAGKIVRGNTRIDPWAGYQQNVVLAARLATGETTSSTTGKTRDISGFGTGEVIWNFLKNKTRPDIAAAVKLAIAAIDSGKDSGVRVTPGEAVKSVVPVPLALREVVEVMRDRGMTEGAIISALAVFGAGVSVYEDKEIQK